MSESTTPWARRSREPRRLAVPVFCGECRTVHQSRWCPECGEQPSGLMVGVLHTEIITHAGERWAVRAERDDESGGWVPVGMTQLSDDDSGTRWGG